MDIKDTVFQRRHRDDEHYDEIKIRMVPRWKSSEMSGDEWRVSAVVEFYRKGHLVFERGFGRMSAAVAAIPWFFLAAGENGETKPIPKALENSLCQQVGCGNTATIRYRLKKEYSRDGSFKKDPTFQLVTQFCDKHKRRGDCGMEDSDMNYEEIPMGEVKISTAEKLATEMNKAGCPTWMIEKAQKYHYDDFRSPFATPCINLVNDLQANGFKHLAERAKSGEFDSQKWESDAWADSQEGQAIRAELGSIASTVMGPQKH
ncbi:MAG: hypothetical protein IPP74_14760 [Alphaproteobacteria bacterium]|nr:hypothetical protein [Alphaproteobacteria bacterium]